VDTVSSNASRTCSRNDGFNVADGTTDVEVSSVGCWQHSVRDVKRAKASVALDVPEHQRSSANTLSYEVVDRRGLEIRVDLGIDVLDLAMLRPEL
jgi:hypothetical protein